MTEKLQKELNVQINAEMWSSNLYLSMAFHLKNCIFYLLHNYVAT